MGFIPPPYGGVSVYVKRLTEQLNRDGYVTRAYKMIVNDEIVNSGFYDDHVRFGIINFIPRYLLFVKETKSCQIVHSHCSLEISIYLWAISFFQKKQVIVTVHNSMVINSYFNVLRVWDRFFLKLLVKQNVKWIAVSQQAKDEMEKLPLKFGLIDVIPAYLPPLSVANISDYLSDSLLTYIKSYEHIITFYAHSFMYNQGIDVYGLADALMMFKLLLESEAKPKGSIGFVFCISNADNEQEYSKIMKLASDYKIHSDIYWQIGPIAEMSTLWQLTDVYVRPTSTDGDSVAVREAIDCGVNVVASDVAPRPSEVFVYDYSDISEFTEKVCAALKNKSNKKNIDQNKNKPFYDKVVSIYEEILKR